MATELLGEEFVTIVPVGEAKPVPKSREPPSFVTVLTVGATSGAAEIVVNRPRGARLGLGLKFEGGSAAAERVRRLLVQSCAEDSPAANTSTPWGKLIPGDEILAIDGVSVSELTRIDCVRRLKDSDETLTLLVRHYGTNSEESADIIDSAKMQSSSSDIVRPNMPPPVPPRKLGKKNSFKDKTLMDYNGHGDMLKMPDVSNGFSVNSKLSRKSSFDSHLLRQNKESLVHLKRGSPEEARRLVRRLSDGKTMPPEAEVYIDLLSTEWERCLAMADAESDDTGSSISTVVDRFGSMASSVENSIPSTPIMPTKTIDIQKVLNCIENIDSDILNDMTTNSIIEKLNNIQDEPKICDRLLASSNINKKEKLNHAPKEEISIEHNDLKDKYNDKNNNSAASSNVTCVNFGLAGMNLNGSKTDLEPEVVEKPKPMPRNSKIESSLNDVKHGPVTEADTLVSSEPLLTPTKKNCIETWLLRSEAELKSKNDDKTNDVSEPEVLPRLIDFVPKPQFKDCDTSPTVTVSCSVVTPTCEVETPPSSLPTDTREDGSGASLDTIGELDETTDSIDIQKTSNDGPDSTEQKARKSSYESGFWEDRVNKSDAEDKSLSNDETPPPSCPRQPPDGIENPFDVVEKPSEVSIPTRLSRLAPSWTKTRPRLSYSRMQDARSEASVKDKIAMFSNDPASCDHLDKCGTLPSKPTITNKLINKYNGYSEVSILDKRLTKSQDNLDEVPRNYNRSSERPDILVGGITSATVKANEPILNYHKRTLLDQKPLYYGSTTSLASSVDSCFSQPIYHSRTSSDENNKNSHKSNLEYLIEQRKKSMSKLRNLMIPDSKAPIVDLPEIKVQDALVKTYLNHSNRNGKIENYTEKSNKTKSSTLNDTKWKSNMFSNNIPKYSPAFKRKSLQVYSPSCLSKESTPERKTMDKSDILKTNNSKCIPSKPPRLSLDVKSFDRSIVSKTSTFKTSELIRKKSTEDRTQNVDIKICTITDIVDSDNDSAMSSTQSSYRSSASSPLHNLDSIESDCSRLSPRVAQFGSLSPTKNCITTKVSLIETTNDEYLKRNVCRSVSSDTNVSLSSSAGSAATSGSQASCSSLESSVADSDKRKNIKVYDIDTINRRNILASAKCRSGRDNKLNSPVMETKFSHESYDRSQSSDIKLSDRLSTLTPVVSAVANKGDNRRRNKVIAESDSESDNEINVRQRKYDFKNTRLKKTNNILTKPKQTEINLETSRIEEAPKAISERIIKEIKKAGLDNYPSATASPIVDKMNGNTNKINKPFVRTIECIEKTISVQHSSKTSAKNEIKSEPANVAKVITKSNVSKIYHLSRGTGSGVGLILAGGIDCEAKEVTIHRVLAESVADKAGLKKGARVLSVNGHTMNGLTHAQSVAVLKEQRPEITIEIDIDIGGVTNGSEKAESKSADIGASGPIKCGSVVTVVLEKAGGGAGLGFGLDGGRDSPLGDKPLTIKKLFAGGAAACSGQILVGAELLSAGGQSLEGFTRTQAWAALKALPAGPVTLVLKNPEP